MAWHSYRGRGDRVGDRVRVRLRGDRYELRSEAGRVTAWGLPGGDPVQDAALRRRIAGTRDRLLRWQLFQGIDEDGDVATTNADQLLGPGPPAPRRGAAAGRCRPLLEALEDPERFALAHVVLADWASEGLGLSDRAPIDPSGAWADYLGLHGIVWTSAVLGCGLFMLGAAGCAQHGHPEPGPPARATRDLPAPPAAPSRPTERRASVPWYDEVQPRPEELLQRMRDIGASPFDGLRNDDPRKRALQFLMETGYFAATGVGIGGDAPAQAGAFGILLDQPEAAEAFAALVDRGDVAGQLYGLCGLYLKDRAAFDRRIGTYRTAERVIEERWGCTSSRVAVKALAEQIAGGEPPRALAHMANAMKAEPKGRAGPAPMGSRPS